MSAARVLRSCAYWVGICVGGYCIAMAVVWTFQAAPDSNIAGGITVGVTFACIGGLWWRSGGQRDTTDGHHNWILGLIKANGELRKELELLKNYLGVDVHVRDVDEGETGPAVHTPAPDDQPDTDEIPVAPPTVPDGMPLAVQSALIERPSPTPRGDSDEAKAKRAAWVEEQLAIVRARIDAAMEVK